MLPGIVPSLMLGGGGFPFLVGYGSVSDTGSSAVVPMPTGVQAGDLLFAACTHQNPGGSVPGTNANWLAAGSDITRSGRSLTTKYRIADGSEGSSQTFTLSSSSCVYAAVILAFRNCLGSVEASAGANGNNASPDPDSLTPSWGAIPSLFVAASGSGTVSDISPDYSGGIIVGNRLCVAFRELIVSTENPSPLSTTTSNNWAARTLAIRGPN